MTTSSNDKIYSREALVKALADKDLLLASRVARAQLRGGGIRDAKFIRKSLEGVAAPAGRQLRVALLSSFSIEFITDILIAEAFAEGVFVDLHVAGFDQYRQEIIDPNSGLYAFRPDVVVLAVEGRSWIPGLYDDYLATGMSHEEALVENGLRAIASLVETFRRNCSAALLIHDLETPRRRALGIADGRLGKGQNAAIGAANERLFEIARAIAGVYVVDYSGLVAGAGASRWFDDRMRFYARAPIASSMLAELAREYVKYLRALIGLSKKCLVVDLDNTLWGGIVGETGPLGVALGSEYPGNAFVAFQRAILDLQRRGIILAIASKNNPADVDEVFKTNRAMLLKKEHFSAIDIGWHDKATSLPSIAKSLSIGLEHIVFVDDNPAECALIERMVPAVRVICLPDQPEHYVDALCTDGLFDGLSLSAEDFRRAELYRNREQAEAARRGSASLDSFYRDLAMTVILEPITPASLPRAAQMTQKTNQFNVTTIRFTEADLVERLGDANWWIRTIELNDRFGGHGVTGLVMARLGQEYVEIDTFLLSCRVIGRTVETAALARLARHARSLGFARIKGQIIPTAKNMPVRDLYERHGFQRDPDDETVWWLDLRNAIPNEPDWLKIVEKVAA